MASVESSPFTWLEMGHVVDGKPEIRIYHDGKRVVAYELYGDEAYQMLCRVLELPGASAVSRCGKNWTYRVPGHWQVVLGSCVRFVRIDPSGQ